ncbi:putative DnaJ domain, Chaperone J-domain superfamily [Dioscorea sansibarensis]
MSARERQPERRGFSPAVMDGGEEFTGKSAYEVLGVSESCSGAEIKASFRRLAKETHPDVSPSSDDSTFLEILAAYEILSDSEKRACYDRYLLSRKEILLKKSRLDSAMYMYNSSLTTRRQSEAVEWLKWYRFTISDIVNKKKVVAGTSYLDRLENEFYSAICAAYYGPIIESMDLLPDCFEAEERSVYDTPEVLHLVSGRDHFGTVNLVEKVPELSSIYHEELSHFHSRGSRLFKHAIEKTTGHNFGSSTDRAINDNPVSQGSDGLSDAYKDLELHISGRVVAMATRDHPKSKGANQRTLDLEDHINVYIALSDYDTYMGERTSVESDSAHSFRSRILLGRISGLGTSAEEGCCSIYDRSGTQTHLIMKHRTLMVKHMHWYQAGHEASICECRCSRARLPPSKLDFCRFWLFEPRSSLHDIGGWYIETFGRDKKGRTVLSQRKWDSITEHSEKRLHPAMYLMALAYRTLDLEGAKRRKRTFRSVLEPKLNNILQWCKKLL